MYTFSDQQSNLQANNNLQNDYLFNTYNTSVIKTFDNINSNTMELYTKSLMFQESFNGNSKNRAPIYDSNNNIIYSLDSNGQQIPRINIFGDTIFDSNNNIDFVRAPSFEVLSVTKNFKTVSFPNVIKYRWYEVNSKIGYGHIITDNERISGINISKNESVINFQNGLTETQVIDLLAYDIEKSITSVQNVIGSDRWNYLSTQYKLLLIKLQLKSPKEPIIKYPYLLQCMGIPPSNKNNILYYSISFIIPKITNQQKQYNLNLIKNRILELFTDTQNTDNNPDEFHNYNINNLDSKGFNEIFLSTEQSYDIPPFPESAELKYQNLFQFISL
jgi:hypothetical protein